jgi:hypothetical protein
MATNPKFASLIPIFGKHPLRNLGTDIGDLFIDSSVRPYCAFCTVNPFFISGIFFRSHRQNISPSFSDEKSNLKLF